MTLSVRILSGQSLVPPDPYYLGNTPDPSRGDLDGINVIFFEVPEGSAPIYFALYHPGQDQLNPIDTPDENNYIAGDDTTYRLVGGSGTIGPSSARKYAYMDIDDASTGGTTLQEISYSFGDTQDNGWVYFDAVYPSQGEKVGDTYYFKIVVAVTGTSFKNGYKIDVSSTNSGSPVSINGVRSFAYGLCVSLMFSSRDWDFYPFVPEGSTGDYVVVSGWDLDDADFGVSGNVWDISVTPLGPTTLFSDDNAVSNESFQISAASEEYGTWQYRVNEGNGSAYPNLSEVWAWRYPDATRDGANYTTAQTAFFPATDEILRMYVAPYNPNPPRYVSLSYDDGTAIGDTSDTELVVLQIVDISGIPVPLSRDIYVSVDNSGEITTKNDPADFDTPQAVGSATTVVTTDDSGSGFITVRRTVAVIGADELVNVSLLTDGTLGSDNFGAGTDETIVITFQEDPDPRISSASNTSFVEGLSQTLPDITVTDSGTGNITALGDLEIRIPAGLSATFDPAASVTLTVGGGGPGRINSAQDPVGGVDALTYTGTLNYTTGNTIAEIFISADFDTTNTLSISGLTIDTAADSDSSGQLELWSQVPNYYSSDDKVIIIEDSNATYTWTGLAGANWSAGGSWTPAGPPAAGSNVQIPDVTGGGDPQPVLDAAVSGAGAINNLYISNGATLDQAGFNLEVSGTFNNDGILLLDGDTETIIPSDTDSGLTRYKGAAGSLIVSGAYYDLEFDSAGQSFVMNGLVTVSSDLTITAGTLNANGNNLTVSGTYDNQDTLSLTGGETLTMTMDTDSGLTVYDDAAGGTLDFTGYYDLTVTDTNSTGDSWGVAGVSTIAGDLTISAGTVLDTGASALGVTGELFNNGTLHTTGGALTFGTFDTDSGVVRYGAATGTVDNLVFWDLEIDAAANIWTLPGALTTGNDLLVTNGTLRTGGNLVVANDLTIANASTLTDNALGHSVSVTGLSGLAGSIVTTNTGISLTGNVTLNGASSLDSSGAGSGDITFGGLLNGTQTLTVDAGIDAVSFNGAVGGTNALTSLTIDSGSVSFLDTVATTTLDVDVTAAGGDINLSLGSTISNITALTTGDNNEITVNANTGNLAILAAGISSNAPTAGGNIDIQTTGDLTFNGGISTSAISAVIAGALGGGDILGDLAGTDITSDTVTLYTDAPGAILTSSDPVEIASVGASSTVTVGGGGHTAGAMTFSHTGTMVLNVALKDANSAITVDAAAALTVNTTAIATGTADGSFTAGTDLDINAALSSGIGNITLTQSGGGNNLTIDAIVNSGTGLLTLDAAGSISQTAAISGGSLLLNGTGVANLPNTSNNFTFIASDLDGTTTYVDTNAITVDGIGITTSGANVSITSDTDTVDIDQPITTANGDITLVAANALSINAALNVGSGSISLTGNPINLGTDITTANGTIDFTGGVILTNDTTVSSGGAGTGDISFSSTIDTDGGAWDLIVDALADTASFGGIIGTGVASGVQPVDLTINADGGVTLGGGVYLGGNLTINAGTTVTTGGNVIDIDGNLAGAGTLTAPAGASAINIGTDMTIGAFNAGGSTVSFDTGSDTASGAVNYVFNNLTIAKAAEADLVTPGGDWTVNGVLTLTTGTFVAGAHTHTVANDWDSSSLNFSLTEAGSTIVLNDTATITTEGLIDPFNNLTLNAGAILAGTAVNVTGTLDHRSVTAISGTTQTLRANTVLLSQDITLTGAGTIEFTGAGAVTLSGDVTLTAPGGTITLDNPVDQTFDLVVNAGAGTVNISAALGGGVPLDLADFTGNTINMGSNVTTANGTIDFTGGVILTNDTTVSSGGAGTGDISFSSTIDTDGGAWDLIVDALADTASFGGIIGTGVASGVQPVDLTINADGGVTLGGGVYLGGNLTINAGTTVTTGGNVIDIDGNLAGAGTLTAPAGASAINIGTDMTIGAFNAGGSTVSFDTGSDTASGAVNYVFNNLTIAKAAEADLVTPGGDWTVNGVLTLTTGTFVAGAHTHTVANDWDSSSLNFSLTEAGSTIVLNDTATITTEGLIDPFNNLTLNAGAILAGTAVNVTGTLDHRSVTAISGTTQTLRANTVLLSQDITLTGAGTIEFTGAGAVTLSGDVTLTAPGGTITLDNPVDQTFDLVVNAGAGTVNISAALGGGVPLDLADFTGNTINMGSNVTTANGTIDFTGGVILTNDTTVSSGGAGTGDISFSSTIDTDGGAWDLIVDALADTASFGGIIGTGVASGVQPVDLTINADGGVTLGGGVYLGGNLTINAGTTVTTGGNVIDIDGNLAGAGTLTAPAGASAIDIGTDMTITAFNAGGSTVSFDTGSDTASGAVNYVFNNLTIAKAAEADLVTPGGDWTVNGVLTLTTGTFVAGAHTHTVANDWDSSSLNFSLTEAGSTIVLTGGNITTEVLTDSFNNLVINTGVTTMLTSVGVLGNLDIDSSLDANGLQLDVYGNWDASGAVFTHGGGLVRFLGPGASTLESGGIGNPFFNLTILDSTLNVDTQDLTVANNLTVDSTGLAAALDFVDQGAPGTLSLSVVNFILTAGVGSTSNLRDWDFSVTGAAGAGTGIENGGIIYLTGEQAVQTLPDEDGFEDGYGLITYTNGAGAGTILHDKFWNLTIDAPAQTIALGNDITIYGWSDPNGDGTMDNGPSATIDGGLLNGLRLVNGTLDAAGNDINLFGSFITTGGTYSHSLGNVVFYGNYPAYIEGDNAFYGFICDSPISSLIANTGLPSDLSHDVAGKVIYIETGSTTTIVNNPLAELRVIGDNTWTPGNPEPLLPAAPNLSIPAVRSWIFLVSSDPSSGTPHWNLSKDVQAQVNMQYVYLLQSDALAFPQVIPADVYVEDCLGWVTAVFVQLSWVRDLEGGYPNGRIDRILVDCDPSLNMDFSDFEVSVDGYTVTGYSAHAIHPWEAEVADPTRFYIELEEQDYLDTDATPSWYIVRNNTLRDTTIGGLVTLYDGSNGAAPTPKMFEVPYDDADPIIGYTLSVADKDEIFLHFSEPVIQNDQTSEIVTGNFNSAAGGGIAALSLQRVSPLPAPANFGMQELLLTTTGDITAAEIASIAQVSVNPAGVIQDFITPTSTHLYDTVVRPDAADTADVVLTPSHRISDIGLGIVGNGIVEPVYAQGSIQPQGGIGPGIVTEFDGTSFLEEDDFNLQAHRYTGLLWNPELVYANDAPASGKNGNLWLPGHGEDALLADNFSGLVRRPYAGTMTNNTPVITGDLFDYSMTVPDPMIDSGKDFEFFFYYPASDLYLGRVIDDTASNWYRQVMPWSILIRNVDTQAGGISILNNIINPNNNEITSLHYTLSRAGMVTIQVFDLSGGLVEILQRGHQDAGDYSVSWNGRNRAGNTVARGIYFVRYVGPGGIDQIRKVLVVK